ncbi:MAG: DUF6378 domain-containing protein [Pseudomonadota bacterium]
MGDIDKTLEERGSRYGKFSTHSSITQMLKSMMQGKESLDGSIIETNWHTLSDSQKESLEMIAHKIGRILNGDPDYDDSWRDIAGYAELVVKELNGEGV